MIQPDDMSGEALQSEPVMERKEVLSIFEDAYRSIKEATGVTNIQVRMCCEKAPAPTSKTLYEGSSEALSNSDLDLTEMLILFYLFLTINELIIIQPLQFVIFGAVKKKNVFDDLKHVCVTNEEGGDDFLQ